MTSTNSCSKTNYPIFDFKLYKNTLKRFSSLILIFSVLLFFALPVATLLLCSEIASYDTNSYITRTINSTFTPEYFVLIFISCAAGIFAALLTWNYLFKKKQTDFYHALPYRRETLFVTFSLAGASIYIIPLLISKVLQFAALITLSGKYLSHLDFGAALAGIGYNIFLLLVFFAFTTLSCMLAGNLPVAICGVFTLLFGFGTFYAIDSLFFLFFDTYLSLFLSSLNNATNLIYSLVTNRSVIFSTEQIIYWGIVSAAILALSFFLYKKRGSETSGHSLVFSRSRPFIKFLIVFSATAFSTIFFNSLMTTGSSSQIPWSCFGFVVGLLISNAVMEVIFDIDIKSVGKGLKGLAVFSVALAIPLACLIFDPFGYDSYLPPVEKLESISFTDPYIANTYVNWSNGNNSGLLNRLNQFTFEDPAVVKDIHSIISKSINFDTNQNYQHYSTLRLSQVGFDTGGLLKKYRQYYDIPADADSIAAYQRIFDSKEYRENIVAFLRNTAEDSVTFRVSGSKTDEYYNDPKIAKQLLEAYLLDFETFSSEDMKKSGVSFYLILLPDSGYNTIYAIYPEFENVISVLESNKIYYPAPMDLSDAAEVTINFDHVPYYYEAYNIPSASDVMISSEETAAIGRNYTDEDYIDRNYTSTDRAEIAKILENALPHSSRGGAPLFLEPDQLIGAYGLSVRFLDNSIVEYYYPIGNVPEYVVELSKEYLKAYPQSGDRAD